MQRVKIGNEVFIKACDGKMFDMSNYETARFYNMFKCIERYIYETVYFPTNDEGWIYIDDEYLFELYKIYLSFLQASVHPNLIKNYNLFLKGACLTPDLLNNQDSIPHVFKDFEYKGKGWYKEDSVFAPECDCPVIKFKDDNDPE